jgi:hypothetical protein
MRVLAALSALLALVSLWSVERAQVAHDLQLAAESSARPGEFLALRALLFRDVDAPEGPTLIVAPATVRLLDAAGRQLAEVALQPTPLDTLDGQLRVPDAIVAELVLEARAEIDGRPLVCRRTLSVAPDARSTRLRGREAGPLQQLSIGRVHAKSAQPAPDPLLARVVGGACVPDRRCRLLVWVGEPAAALSVRSTASAELVEPPSPASETAGLVALSLIVRGPDAEITLQARRAGELVAERALRLPIGLGEVAIYAREAIAERAQIRFDYEPPPGRQHILADVFAAGRWRASRVLPGGELARSYTLDESASAPGLLRLQARSDRFSAEGSGARVLYVRAPGEDDSRALARIAGLVAAEPSSSSQPTAAWANTLPSFATSDPQRAAAFMLAPLEELRLPVPIAVSGRPAQLRALLRTRVVMRFGVAGALVVSALALALSIARRGLSATSEAEAILLAARGEDEAPAPYERFRARANVALFVLAVVSAFLAGALLIAAKPLWF